MHTFSFENIEYINGEYFVCGTPAPLKGAMYSPTYTTYRTKDIVAFLETRLIKELALAIKGLSKEDYDNLYTMRFGIEPIVLNKEPSKTKNILKIGNMGSCTIWDGKKYTRVSEKNIETSKDNHTWKKCVESAKIWFTSIGFNGKDYIAAGDSDATNDKQDWIYYYSKDGLNWEERVIKNADTQIYNTLPTKDGFILAGTKIWYIKTKDVKGAIGGSNQYVETKPSKPEGYGLLSTKLSDSIKQIQYNDITQQCMVVSDNNHLYQWGRGIGNQKIVSIDKPQLVMKDVIKAVDGIRSAGAITTNGDFYMWGENDDKNIADISQILVPYPIKIMSGVKEAAIGPGATYVVKKNGDLLCKGTMFKTNTLSIQFMEGNQLQKYVDYAVKIGEVEEENKLDILEKEIVYKDYTKIMENVKEVKSRGMTTAVIKGNNELFMWGNNCNGELATDDDMDRSKPVKVMENVKQVEIGNSFIMALTTNGDVYIWGEIGEFIGKGRDKIVGKPYKHLSGIKYIDAGEWENNYLLVKNNGDLLLGGEEFYTYKNNKYTKNKKICSHAKQGKIGMGGNILVLLENGKVMTKGNNQLGFLGTGEAKEFYPDKFVNVLGFNPSNLRSCEEWVVGI